MIRKEYKWLTDIYVAHRGLFDNQTLPENSIPAFEKASAMGFGIETDVQSTKDGVLVVFHDYSLERMTGTSGQIGEHTFEELRKLRLLDTDCVIPTFEEFLQAANGANLVVEIKPHGKTGYVEEKTYEMLKNYKGNYCIESFDPFVIRWFKKNAPEVIKGTLSCAYEGSGFGRIKKWILRELKLCKWNGSQFIAFDATTLKSNKAVKRFGKRIPILCWTIRSQEELNKLEPYFDNIIFDGFVPERRDLAKLK
ncbi:MAG: hypothetical protein NC132_00115 [Corallococcus sp.]|nr:hypothetical protein [Corallococcus sp.]MCM1359128.1 hypothetical protein [Corallococcus sp.]MCM1394518.1 hypothetical protein [Corallococcus sp.]